MWEDVSVLDKAGQEVTQAAPTCIDPLASASRVLGLEDTPHLVYSATF